MKKFLFAIFCGVLCGLGAAAWKQAKHGRPVLNVSTKVLDYGHLPPNREFSRLISITNQGRADLFISRIQTGCGCTRVKLRPGNRIAPGKSATLEVTIKLDQQAASAGKISSVLLFSNDPEHPLVQLIAKAAPSTADAAYPDVVDFGSIDRLKLPVSREFVIQKNLREDGPSKWEVLETLEEPGIQLSKNNALDTDMGERYRVTWLSTMPTGDVYTLLRVHNTLAKTTGVIVIRGHVRGHLIALPQMVVLGPLYYHDRVSKEMVRIRSRQNTVRRLTLESVQRLVVSRNLIDLIKCDLSNDHEGLLLTISANPGQPGQTRSSQKRIGFVRLEVSHPDGEYERLNIPISITMKMPRIRGA